MTPFKPPPASPEAEDCLLGSLLMSTHPQFQAGLGDDAGHLMERVREVLPSQEPFYDVGRRKIYQVMLDLNDEGTPVDSVTVVGKLSAEEDRQVCVTAVRELLALVASPANALRYAQNVADAHRRRRAIQLGRRLCEAAESGNGQFEAAIRRIPAELGEKPDSSSDGWPSTTLEALLAEPEQEITWLVDGLLPAAGLSLLVAKPKVGKSVTSRNLAFSASQNAPFLGRACRGGPVVLISLEDTRPDTANHFRKLGATNEPIDVTTERPAAQSNSAMIAKLRAKIERTHSKLAIIDTVGRLIDVSDWNGYGDCQRALGPFIDLAHATGCHVMLLHHCVKAERVDGDSVLGSTAVFGMVDTVLTMRKDGETRIMSAIGRYGVNMEPTIVTLDKETWAISAGGSVRAVRQGDIGKVILELLDGQPGLTEPELRDAVKASYKVVHDALGDLTDAGAVERSGTGARGHPFRFSTPHSPIEGVESGATNEGLFHPTPTLPSPDRPGDRWVTDA